MKKPMMALAAEFEVPDGIVAHKVKQFLDYELGIDPITLAVFDPKRVTEGEIN